MTIDPASDRSFRPSTGPAKEPAGPAEADFESTLADLLTRALDAIERGEPIDVEALCADHPGHRAAVAAALRRSRELPGLHRAAASADAAVGSVLVDRYRLVERIGAGAMGVVYAGEDAQLHREVAIKVLRPELVVGARMDVRLSREAEVLARIRHPNVVTVHDRGQAADGRSFLVLERLHGCTLAHLLRNETTAQPTSMALRLARFRQRLDDPGLRVDSDVRLCVDWIVQAAAGVQAAHEAGVVHRDLKPSNLFVERGGRVVVLDFGIVSVGEHPTVGSDGSPLGTPAYMAPEQVDGEREPDVRCDVYSLAATLYHLLTGRAPYGGTVPQVLQALARREPPAADQVRPGLPGDLVAVLEKGMARQPELRYASMAEFRDELIAWREHRPVAARRASWLVVTARRLRRSPMAHGLLVALVLAAVVVGWWRHDETLAAERTARDAACWAAVPPSLVCELPANRASSALRREPSLDALFDRWLADAAAPWLPLALRAQHRADGGDLALAADDVARVVALGEAPFAERLLAAYRVGQLLDPIPTDAAPPVVGALHDRFLLVLHTLRSPAAPPAWAETLLEVAGSDVAARACAELRLLARMQREQEREPIDVHAYERIERECGAWEARHGASALGCLLLINTFNIQGRHDEAVAQARRGQQLARSDSLFPLLAGAAVLATGDVGQAVPLLQQAIALQPRSAHAHQLLCDALVGADRFDEAERIVESAPYDAGPRGRAQYSLQRGVVRLGRFEQLRRTGGDDPATRAAAEALLRDARAAFAAHRVALAADAVLEEIVCAGLLGESVSVAQMLDLLAGRATDADLLHRVAQLLPDELDAAATVALKRLLEAQAEALGSRSP